MEPTASFGYWLRRRRKALDLTQDALAQQAGCALGTLKKIETDQRRPSRQLAERLAACLAIPTAEQADFIRAARSELATDRLAVIAQSIKSKDAVTQPLDENTRSNNLPAQPTALIGREREIAEVCALLHGDGVRLLTLTGPGGIGKTRLAIQAAAKQLDAFPDGVWFVNLAPIHNTALVLPTIAQVLGVTELGGQPIAARLKSYLHAKQLLLLLDNFEQVINPASPIAELLAAAPNLKVLVTSRAMLRIYGEHEFAVPPLALPPTDDRRLSTDEQAAIQAETVAQYEAVRLFIAQARAAKHDFALTNANASAVAAICRRLDGLPLAIELAAARIKLFMPEALLARLSQPLALLIGGPRDLPARQQTLRNTIDWSYNLLEEDERALFRRLAVFVGGCTLEAAEFVNDRRRMLNDEQPNPLASSSSCMVHPASFDLLVSLFDKSLLRREIGPDGEPRFVMLETVREYALERLEESGEANSFYLRQAQYFLTQLELVETQPLGAGQPTLLQWWKAEQDNLRAALRWSLRAPAGEELNLRLAIAIVPFMTNTFDYTESNEWLERALEHTRELNVALEPLRLKAMTALGVTLATLQQDYTHAIKLLEESLAIYRRKGDSAGIADVLIWLGRMARDQGNYHHAQIFEEESLALFREQQNASGIAWVLQSLGDVALDQGDLIRATVRFQEAIAIAHNTDSSIPTPWAQLNLGKIKYAAGDITGAALIFEHMLTLFRDMDHWGGVAQTLLDLGRVARAQGDNDRAIEIYRESLPWCHKDGSIRDISYCLAALAWAAGLQKHPIQAVRLFGAAEALRTSVGIHPPPILRAEYERDLATVRAQLDDAAFAAAWSAGQQMTLEQTIAEALAGSSGA